MTWIWIKQNTDVLGEHNNLKLDKDNEIEFCQEYKYLGVIFDSSGTDDKEIRSRVIWGVPTRAQDLKCAPLSFC